MRDLWEENERFPLFQVRSNNIHNSSISAIALSIHRQYIYFFEIPLHLLHKRLCRQRKVIYILITVKDMQFEQMKGKTYH